MIPGISHILLAVSTIGLAGTQPSGQRAPDQLPLSVNSCAICHRMPELFQGERSHFLVPPEQMAKDVHGQKGVMCHQCHGGNPIALSKEEAHSREVSDPANGIYPFRFPLSEMSQACGRCHEQQQAAMAESVHATAWKDAEGNAQSLSCGSCHGQKKHSIQAVSQADSPVFAKHQMQLCGGCHQKPLEEYEVSVHGHALIHSGLTVTAVCADCHGAHGIFRAADPRSQLHVANVAETCGQCHRFIEERIQQSVHGNGGGPGVAADRAAPGGKIRRTPSCTDCHMGHDLPDPRSDAFRVTLADRCGTCHEDLFRQFKQSMHGQLSNLGYGPGAKCSDCHGAHDILSADDPNSLMAAGANRLETCRKCHAHAVSNFSTFLPHADYHDADRYPLLHAIYVSMELLIYSVFAFFTLHSLLWFLRSLIHVVNHGRPRRLRAGEQAIVRFAGIHQLLHAVVVVSFLGLALTGLPLRYSDQAWAHRIAAALGGFDSTGLWHHICGIVTILYFAAHLAWLARKLYVKTRSGKDPLSLVFGPDSPVPNWRDAKDMWNMFRWFFGRGSKPGFDRWTYWEKFDYWAVFWGVGVIGTSGLILWFPNFFCLVLPGVSLNIAKVVHSEEALLATSFIFAVHFFGTHLRPEKFPMDMAVLSGLVSEQEMRDERPDFVARMERDGTYDQLRTTVPSASRLRVIAAAGFVALSVGVALLTGILVAIYSIRS